MHDTPATRPFRASRECIVLDNVIQMSRGLGPPSEHRQHAVVRLGPAATTIGPRQVGLAPSSAPKPSLAAAVVPAAALAAGRGLKIG